MEFYVDLSITMKILNCNGQVLPPKKVPLLFNILSFSLAPYSQFFISVIFPHFFISYFYQQDGGRIEEMER